MLPPLPIGACARRPLLTPVAGAARSTGAFYFSHQLLCEIKTDGSLSESPEDRSGS